MRKRLIALLLVLSFTIQHLAIPTWAQYDNEDNKDILIEEIIKTSNPDLDTTIPSEIEDLNKVDLHMDEAFRDSEINMMDEEARLEDALTIIEQIEMDSLPAIHMQMFSDAKGLGDIFPQGVGTEENPYLISEVNQLIDVRELVHAGNTCEGIYFKLTKNIDISDILWIPIGKAGLPFSGHFDGNHKAIKGLTINTTSGQQSFFGIMANGSIKNLILIDASVTAGNSSAILATILNGCTVENISVLGTVRSTSSQIAGVVASVSNSELNDIYFDGEVETSADFAGGIASFFNNSKLEYAEVRGSVTGKNYTGGIIGETFSNKELNVRYTINRGTVTGNIGTGGIIGFAISSSANHQMANHANLGDVTGNSRVGGILGEANVNYFIINVYNQGSIQGNSQVGGILGSSNYPTIRQNSSDAPRV